MECVLVKAGLRAGSGNDKGKSKRKTFQLQVQCYFATLLLKLLEKGMHL